MQEHRCLFAICCQMAKHGMSLNSTNHLSMHDNDLSRSIMSAGESEDCDSDCTLACKGNGADSQAGGQSVNVVLPVALHIWQVLGDCNDCCKDCHKAGDKSANTSKRM